MKSLYLGASALMLLAGAAFAAPPDKPGHTSPAPGTTSETASAMEDSAAGMVGKISAEMTSTTQGFVTAAATSDMYEVEAGSGAPLADIDTPEALEAISRQFPVSVLD